MALPNGQPHEYGVSTPFPDLMNDPAFATNYDGKERSWEDPDTCRICRGEGSEEEQLFYPCKCSGSIKFVHQACLVEWLSHSQKKHCELCKTPFRFTKLYDPNMPQELPAPLFVKQVLLHSFRTVVTWLRFSLVAFVWLVWLPWSMRAMWRALFWLADGRWPSSHRSSSQDLAPLMANGSAVNATTAGSATAGMPSSQTSAPSIFSFPTGDPVMLSFIKKAFSIVFFPGLSSTASSGSSTLANANTGSRQRHPSWLSDVKFLNSLTPSPTFNNILIDTLEGQLITLLVVISFILVFLIREWVVQQQPMANIADGEREAAVQLIANNRQNEPADAHHPEDRPPLQADPRNGAADGDFENLDDEDGGDAHSAMSEGSTQFYRLEDSNEGDSNDETHGHSRHQQPEQLDHIWPGVETFRDLWTRANGDPQEVLRIVREEGRQEELNWVVLAMTRLQTNDWSQSSVDNAGATSAISAITDNSRRANADDITDEVVDEDSGSISENFPSSSSRVQFGSSSQTAAGPSWNPSMAPGASSSNNVQPGTTQPDFVFNFLDPAHNSANPFETQPPRQIQAPVQAAHEGDHADSASALAASNTQDDNADFPGNVPQPAQSDHTGAQDQPPKSLTHRILDWFWGDITPADVPQERLQHDEEHVVEDPALEAPFVPVQNNRRPGDGEIQEAQGMGAGAENAGADANDVDAIEDGDDLEGILELIGMQGPIFGLLQNGVFSALLISFTVAIGIWLPYLWGKIALVILANPIQLMLGVPMAAVSIVADITIDTLIGSLGYIIYWASLICKVFLSPFSDFNVFGNWIPQTKSVTSASLSLIDASSHRLKQVANAFFMSHESDIPVFSVLSHQALRMHEARITGLFRSIFAVSKFVIHDFPLRIITSGLRGTLNFDYEAAVLSNVFVQGRDQVYGFASTMSSLLASAKWVHSGAVKASPVNIPADADLAVWNTKDRVIAIIMGYVLVSILGLMYLRLTGLLSGVNRGQRIEGLVAEVLQQAGGVMKVILIIGIEMIVFPLYCGSLLDVALLPLFENATIASRIDFTSSSPLTSLFVHWFIGTCYMFHFALFVSMCRKIMRSGVLYFIRDPDDPTFHPVRDVLERNITTQLRKIAFSALVYGALVIVCLGGVVWGLHHAFDGVLPVHWSATIPVLEFPVDLLFYNFVMPLALRSIKPSDGLQSLYDWWFHKCARFLRLSNFFFGETERWRDEEGYHVGRTWLDVLTGKKGDVEHPITSEEQLSDKKEGVYFVRDGRYVRAPASDQVRIPKGSRVFLEVTEDNKRLDRGADQDNDLHSRNSDMFAKVYIPPNFRTRIASFILLIWVFAATSGVGITIIPLVIGRKLMSSYFPESVPLNDIYAFCTGLCIFGGAVYAVVYGRSLMHKARDYLHPYMQSPREACLECANVVLNGCRLAYITAAFGVLLPSLLALIMELYVLVPLHTYFGGTHSHVIHFVQDWTLGVLYVQMAVKFVLWHSASRPAAALNGIFRNGWLRPNASLASRALVLPVSILAGFAVTLPLFFGLVLNLTVFSSTPDVHSKVYRYSYPVALFIGLAIWTGYMAHRRVELWRVNIRDDVYLIGERLHNFSEKRAKDVGAARRVITG